MKLDPTGKVAVVSGSTSGIGQGIAAGLAKSRRNGGCRRP